MANQLFATKSIAQCQEQDSADNKLRRALSATALTQLGIGAHTTPAPYHVLIRKSA